jgi:hypothetical protein
MLGAISRFQFPDIDEVDHRFSRTSTFLISSTIAVLPFAINSVWRIVSGKLILRDFVTMYEGCITDLTFAGVVVAISTFTNTYFSDAKLAGWTTLSRSTFFALFGVAVCAIFNLIGYIETTHKYFHVSVIDDVLYGNFCLTLSTLGFSYVAIYSFCSDEIRQASTFAQTLPG